MSCFRYVSASLQALDTNSLTELEDRGVPAIVKFDTTELAPVSYKSYKTDFAANYWQSVSRLISDLLQNHQI